MWIIPGKWGIVFSVLGLSYCDKTPEMNFLEEILSWLRVSETYSLVTWSFWWVWRDIEDGCGEGRRAWWNRVVHFMAAKEWGTEQVLSKHAPSDSLPPARRHLLILLSVDIPSLVKGLWGSLHPCDVSKWAVNSMANWERVFNMWASSRDNSYSVIITLCQETGKKRGWGNLWCFHGSLRRLLHQGSLLLVPVTNQHTREALNLVIGILSSNQAQ